jgi:hypothetical protein
MISVRELYNQVCDSILEPDGLTGLTVSESDFIRFVNDAVRLLFSSSDCFIYITNKQIQVGVDIYSNPYWVNQISTVLCDESNLTRGSGSYWDNSDYRWQMQGPGNPEEWRNDQLQENQIQVRPTPYWNGYELVCISGQYGTFSQNPLLSQKAFQSNAFQQNSFQVSNTPSSTNGTININCDPSYLGGFIGTISKADLGSVYLNVVGPMFGVVSDMVPSDLNLSQFVTYTQDIAIDSIDGVIADIPDSFTPYIKFAVLSYIFSMDGESKNNRLTKYYKQRFEEIVRLLRSVSSDALLSVK